MVAGRARAAGLCHDTCRQAHADQHAGCFAFFAPKQYQHMAETVQAVLDHNNKGPGHCTRSPFVMNFKNSVYPMAVWNFGPQSVSFDHLDLDNEAGTWCAIQSAGNFDPELGGHLVLFDLGLIIKFLPGLTVLIPSALLRHGNTPIQPGKKRFLFTQFCAGGLMQ
jgi:hypothetical protein